MLNQVEARDIPAMSSGKPASPMRAFADEAAREFLEGYSVGESAELTGWPADAGRSAEWCAARARLATMADAMADICAEMEGLRGIDYAASSMGGDATDILCDLIAAKDARLRELQAQAHGLEAIVARAAYCLGRMPDQRHAALLEARYLNGRPWGEVARAIGCSRQHLHRLKLVALAGFYESMMERDKVDLPSAI